MSFTASGRALFYLFAALLVGSSFGLLYLLNNALLVSVPARGGELVEGIIGNPRFINPVIAATEADRDLVALIYSGLLKATPEGGYVPDLAVSYSVSEDGTVYTFTLRQNATFHDDTPVTAEDIAYTIAKIQDPGLRSPLRSNWEGVTVEALDASTVRFTLRAPYAPFIKNLTLGILPKHLWENVSAEEFPYSERNTMPVGSGPFVVGSLERSASGLPLAYELWPFEHYTLGAPYLERLTLRFYQNEQAVADALNRGIINAAGGLSAGLVRGGGEAAAAALTASSEAPEDTHINRAPLNRVFGVFFNQNQSEVLRDWRVREALEASVDRQGLVDRVLGGAGMPLTEPAPMAALGDSTHSNLDTWGEENIAAARAQLENAGWEPNEEGVLQKILNAGKDDEKTLVLAFSLSTGNVPELRAAAEELRTNWEKLGAKVDVQVFEQGDLSQNVIRPRRYDALLFGEIVGHELDLYPFWHSSQRNDPGLNIALYANSAADKALEAMRATTDEREQQIHYGEFLAQITEDRPAVFLYSPDYVYYTPNAIEGLELGFVESPSDRFLSVAQWHMERERVWPFFMSK